MLDANSPPMVDDIPNQTAEERREKMEEASVRLERYEFFHRLCLVFFLSKKFFRKLSQRPTAEELELRNILRGTIRFYFLPTLSFTNN